MITRLAVAAALLAAATATASTSARAAELIRGEDRWICGQTTPDGQACVGRFEIRFGDGTVGEYGTTIDGRRWLGPQRERYPDGGEQRCTGSSPQRGLCIGDVTVTTGDGITITGSREVRDLASVWTGRLTIRTGQGTVITCAAAAIEDPGYCDGEATMRFPDGSERRGTLRPNPGRGGNDWTGPFQERLAGGSRFDCDAATATGRCNGNGRLAQADGKVREARFVDGVEVVDAPLPSPIGD